MRRSHEGDFIHLRVEQTRGGLAHLPQSLPGKGSLLVRQRAGAGLGGDALLHAAGQGTVARVGEKNLFADDREFVASEFLV